MQTLAVGPNNQFVDNNSSSNVSESVIHVNPGKGEVSVAGETAVSSFSADVVLRVTMAKSAVRGPAEAAAAEKGQKGSRQQEARHWETWTTEIIGRQPHPPRS